MTVSTTVRSVDQAGNGVTLTFGIPFPWQNASDLVVQLIDNATGAITTQTIITDYSLTGGDPSGTITMVVAPPVGKTLHVERVVDYTQTADFVPNDGFDAELTEDVFDRIVMMIQQAAAGAAGGSTITVAGIGSGQNIVAGLVGSQYQLKSLKAAGTGLAVANDATSITYTLSGVLLAANNLSDVAARQTALNTLTAVAGGTNEFVLTKDTATGNAIWKAVPGGGGGEANTISSTGATGNSLVQTTPKVGIDLRVRGIIAGSNVTITNSGGTDWTIAATGEANTLVSDAATGQSLVNAKVGTVLHVKGIAPSTAIAIGSTANDLTVAVDQTAALAWTGRHTWTRNATADSANLAIASNNNGTIPTSDNLLASGYLPVVDIRKTSDAAAYNSSVDDGGVFGLYVQHDVSGVSSYSGPFTQLHGGIRSQVRSNGVTGNPDGITAFYGGTVNKGALGTVAWGYFVDVYHNNSNSGSASYGFTVEFFRDNAAGRCDAFVAKNMIRAGIAANTGFLIRKDGASPPWEVGFGVGASTLNGQADVGFDTNYGTITTAAIRLASGHLLRLGGLTTNADVKHNTASAAFGGSDNAIEFLAGGNTTLAVRTDGIVAFRGTSLTNVGAAGGATALPATPLGYMSAFVKHPATGLPVAVKFPFYNF